MKKLWVLAAAVVVIGAGCVAPPPAPKDCTLRGPGVDLRGCDLRGAWFLGEERPDDEWNVVNMSGARLDGANLAGAYFGEGVDFTGASFSRASLIRANFYSTEGRPGPVRFSDVDFTGADLSTSNLENYSLAGDFTGANLRDLTASWGASLSGTFTEADLSGSSFYNFGGVGGDLQGAVLRNTNFGNASLAGDLRGADLTGAEFGGFPGGPTGDARGAIFDQVTFNGTEVLDLNLGAASVLGATFTDTALRNVDFTGADLTGSTFDERNTFTNVTWFNTTCPNGVVQSTPCV